MQKTYTDYINAALDILDQSLPEYVVTRLQVRYGNEWFSYVPRDVHYKGEEICWDTQAILKTMTNNWSDAFHSELNHEGRNFVSELREWRNQVAHRSPQSPIDYDAAYRAVDTVWRLLRLIPLPQAQDVRLIRDELQGQNVIVAIPQAKELKTVQQKQNPADANPFLAANQGEANVAYNYKRFCFKASKIEPLQDDQTFRVVTPNGSFQMTKAEFYRAFPKVVISRSYTESGLYHYPSVPKSALPYEVTE